MERSNGRLRLLVLREIFLNKTDEENILTASELCEELSKRGIFAERKTIYADIKALRDFGMNIIQVSVPKKGYYFVNRLMSFQDLCYCVNSVRSAAFLTKSNKDDITEKLCCLASEQKRAAMTNNIYVYERYEANGDITKRLDMICAALTDSKQLVIKYNIDKIKNGVPYEYGDAITVDPLRLFCLQTGYYLLFVNRLTKKITHLPVSAITGIQVLMSETKAPSEMPGLNDFDITDYIERNFFTFEDGERSIRIRCDNSRYAYAVSLFGKRMRIIGGDEKVFTFETKVRIDDEFLAMITGSFGRLVLEEPKDVRSLICERALKIAELYKK